MRNHIQTASHDGRSLHTPASLDKLGWLLDAAFAIPGTRWRIGVDALLGLIPGVGDTFGAALSSYIIYVAARQGASIPTLVKMVGNVVLEAVVGLIPVVGDIFDVAWRANLRNLDLLRAERDSVVRSQRSSRQVALMFASGAGLIFILLFMSSFFLMRWIYQFITG